MGKDVQVAPRLQETGKLHEHKRRPDYRPGCDFRTTHAPTLSTRLKAAEANRRARAPLQHSGYAIQRQGAYAEARKTRERKTRV